MLAVKLGRGMYEAGLPISICRDVLAAGSLRGGLQNLGLLEGVWDEGDREGAVYPQFRKVVVGIWVDIWFK